MPIRTSTRKDLSAIDGLLAASKLPALESDVFQPEDFRVAEEGRSTLGAIGIERYETDGLLRSLVVTPQARGRGIGESLVSEIENHARAIGLRSLYLLTTTADKFFDKLEYDVIPRGDMPATVQQSSEFSTLCPASAVCMHKTLNGGAS